MLIPANAKHLALLKEDIDLRSDGGTCHIQTATFREVFIVSVPCEEQISAKVCNADWKAVFATASDDVIATFTETDATFSTATTVARVALYGESKPRRDNYTPEGEPFSVRLNISLAKQFFTVLEKLLGKDENVFMKVWPEKLIRVEDSGVIALLALCAHAR